MSNLNFIWLRAATLCHISWNSNIRVAPFFPGAWLLLRSNQALGERGVTLFFENRKNKKSTSRYLKIMKNGGFLFKIGRKLRPAALWSLDTQTPFATPVWHQQRQQIPYAALLSVYETTKRRNIIRANARAETRLRRKLKRASWKSLNLSSVTKRFALDKTSIMTLRI